MSDEQPSATGPTGKPRKTKEMFPYGGRGGINPKHANLTPEQRCQGHKKNGEQCKLPPILGARVCRQHGGAAPQVKAAAKVRLEMAADDAVSQLKRLMMSGESDAVKLAAAKDILDRAGLSASKAVALTHEMGPRYERVFDRIYRGPGMFAGSEPPTVVDGEIVPGAAEFDDGREP